MHRRWRLPPHLRQPFLNWARKEIQKQNPGGFSRGKEASILVEFCCNEIPSTFTAEQVLILIRKVYYSEGHSFFKESHIDAALIKMLSKAVLRGNEEAAQVLLRIEEIAAFDASASQEDEECERRHFHKARSLKEWKRICEKNDACVFFDTETVKLVFFIEEACTKELRNRLAEEVGESFWSHYKYWKLWFNLRDIGHYYVYIDKNARRTKN